MIELDCFTGIDIGIGMGEERVVGSMVGFEGGFEMGIETALAVGGAETDVLTVRTSVAVGIEIGVGFSLRPRTLSVFEEGSEGKGSGTWTPVSASASTSMREAARWEAGVMVLLLSVLTAGGARGNPRARLGVELRGVGEVKGVIGEGGARAGGDRGGRTGVEGVGVEIDTAGMDLSIGESTTEPASTTFENGA